MRKCRWFLVLYFCAALALLAFAIAGPPREPVYKGKKLSYWVHLWTDSLPQDDTKNQAQEAIRAIGHDALPFLLQWLRSEPRLNHNVIDRIFVSTPVLRNIDSLNEWLHHDKREELADDTEYVFGILDRHVAKLAVPKLTTYVNDAKHHYTALRAAVALSHIGEDGVPSLLQVLEQPCHQELQAVMCALAWNPPKGTNAALAAKLTARYTRSRGLGVADTAAYALGAIATDPQTSLAALTEALTSGDPDTRATAASSIAKFGTNAQVTIPLLLGALKDPSGEVRTAVSNAIATIQPEGLPSPIMSVINGQSP